MRLVYSFSADVSRCFIEARVDTVTPATYSMDTGGLVSNFPVLLLEYTLNDLLALAPMFGAMQATEEPEIFIWNESAPEPEIAIFFRKFNASQATLDEIAGRTGHTLTKIFTEAKSTEIFTIAEVNLNRAVVQEIIRQYTATGTFMVDVYEKGQRSSGQPLQRFVIQSLNRKSPAYYL